MTKNYLFAILVTICFNSCCDEGTFIINEIKVYPYDKVQKKVSETLNKEICFLIELDITKHKNGRRKIELIQTASATPPCEGYINEIPLKKLKIYSDKIVYFQPYSFNKYGQQSNYYFLQPIAPYTNLTDIDESTIEYFSFDEKYYFPNDTACLNKEARRSMESPFYSEFSGEKDFFDFTTPLRFPKGKYRFWFEWTFWDGKVFKDSTTLFFNKDDNSINLNYTSDTSINIKDSIKTITYNSKNGTPKYSVKFMYYISGNIAGKEFYLNDKKYGRFINLYKNGKIKEIGFYANDKKSKFPYTLFYPNGAIKMVCFVRTINVERINYKKPEDIACYESKYYKEDGKIDKIESYSRSKDKLIQLIKYKDCKINYECIWNEEGKKREEKKVFENDDYSVKRWDDKGVLKENWYEFYRNRLNTICDRNDSGKIVRFIYIGKPVSDTNIIKKKLSKQNYNELMGKKF